MARARNTSGSSSAWDRRNQRARALGYQSYYDYRAHDNGRIAPDAPRLRGSALRRARGHASGKDLRASSKPGDRIVASMGGRDNEGKYHRVDITLIGADGTDKEFVLRGAQINKDYLLALVADLENIGVIFSPSPSLDLRHIAETSSE